MDLHRRRLEATLDAKHLFGSKEIVEGMVREQLLASPLLGLSSPSSEDGAAFQVALDSKTADLWEAIQSLRSVSTDKEWKVVEDTKSLRIKYRHGAGSPFQCYSVEGVVNAPLSHALCVMWEIPFFKTWWPHFNVPAFKVLESKLLRGLRVCENLFKMRLKAPWPMAVRELLLNAFLLEVADEEAVFGTLQTVDSAADFKEAIHGYDASALPPLEEDIVRMDANGGFIIHRVSETQCYIRAYIQMDLKLDYVPPWIINFIGRQVVGHGFRLYLKTVSSVKNEKMFLDSIENQPIYRKISEQMTNKQHNKNGYV